MRELVFVKKLNKLSELKVASLDLHIIYSQGVAKEFDANQNYSSKTFITFTKHCPCCSMDLNIHVFLYENKLIPLKLRYMLPTFQTPSSGNGCDNQTECSESSYASGCSEQINCVEADDNESKIVEENDTQKNDESNVNVNETQSSSTVADVVETTTGTKCEFCNKILPTDEKVLYHHFYYHKNLEMFKCNLCSKQIVNKKRAVEDHIATHSAKNGKPFICALCGGSFSNRIGIKNHLINIHAPPEKRSLACNDCPDKKFTSKLNLDKHNKSCHSSKPCPHCGLVFKASNLRRHIDTTHLKKEYKCLQCDVVCNAKDSLRSHIRRVHNTETAHKYQCPHCQKHFADLSRYKRHLMVHDDSRPYCCETCNKRFREKTNLESHLRTHTKQRPYECLICSKKFSDRGSYRNHIKSHEKATGLQLDKSIKKFKAQKSTACTNPS